jgi:hypothetical protein
VEGGLVCATPEWAGACPGTVSFHTGHGHLLVAPDAPMPELDALMELLVREVGAAAAVLDREASMRMTLLAAGLELVAGRLPASAGEGTAEDVFELALAGIRARTQGLAVQVVGPLPRDAVPAPAAIALALVQLAVNAQQHEQASRVLLRVTAGPTFAVEWPAGPEGAGAVQVRSHRHALRRTRWGWGYVQLVADALGGAALPPGPAGPGMEGACLGLGSPRLTLPVACVRGGRVARSTQTWDEGSRLPGLGQPADGLLGYLVESASANAGRIVYHDLYRSRSQGDRCWVVLAPESGSSRAHDLLRGLQHERALWTAPGPHSTRLPALATLLEVALGEPWPSVPPSLYAELLPVACASLGVPLPEPVTALALPEPRVVALLLRELGGRLLQRGEEVYFEPPPSAPPHPLLRALRPGPNGRVRLTETRC